MHLQHLIQQRFLIYWMKMMFIRNLIPLRAYLFQKKIYNQFLPIMLKLLGFHLYLYQSLLQIFHQSEKNPIKIKDLIIKSKIKAFSESNEDEETKENEIERLKLNSSKELVFSLLMSSNIKYLNTSLSNSLVLGNFISLMNKGLNKIEEMFKNVDVDEKIIIYNLIFDNFSIYFSFHFINNGFHYIGFCLLFINVN